jgi:hypothetical protein
MIAFEPLIEVPINKKFNLLYARMKTNGFFQLQMKKKGFFQKTM